MPLPILALALVGGVVAKALDPNVGSHFDDISVTENEGSLENEEELSSFEEETQGEEISEPAEEPFQATLPPPPSSLITLRRGDRFICPETGQELQVRAVGGRPMHQPQDDFRYS